MGSLEFHMERALAPDDLESFMAGVAIRLSNARDPSYVDMTPYDAWCAACSAIEAAILEEIEERRNQRAIRSNIPSGV